MAGAVGEPMRVLYVDDDPDLRAVVQVHLEGEHDEFEVLAESDVDAALARLREESVDCVVSDHDVPGHDGLAFLRRVRESFPDLPFVLFTGTGSEEVASEAITAGVTEYLRKDTGSEQYAVLADRIERAVAERRPRSDSAESERMLATLIRNLPGMVYRCSDEAGWPMAFVSDGAEPLTGYDAAAIEDGSVDWERDVVVPEDQAYTRAVVERALRDGTAFEVTYRIEGKAGDRRWVWERGRAVGGHDCETVLEGFITDVTARKEAARERERYETVVKAIGDPVYMLDADGHFTFVNEALEALSGYDREELLGEHAEIVMTAADRRRGQALVRKLLADEDDAYETYEVDIVTEAGETVPCEIHVALLGGSGEAFAGTAGVLRDVTDRRSRERRLEEFASVVSHDLRSPLTVIQGVVDYVQSTGDADELHRVADAADRMEELIDRLLALAHEGHDAEDREAVEVEPVARAAWEQIVAEDAALTVETDAAVRADPSRLQELFENLFGNAVEHGRRDRSPAFAEESERGGHVGSQGGGHPWSDPADGAVVTLRVGDAPGGFYVADDGPGIPPSDREVVFERGFTTSDEGTGYGLAIVRTVAETHGWSITVEESAAGGARFEVETGCE